GHNERPHCSLPRRLVHKCTVLERRMDIETLRRHLEWSAAQAAWVKRLVAKHRIIVATQEREDRDTEEAKKVLAKLELCLEIHTADWGSLRSQLGLAAGPIGSPLGEFVIAPNPPLPPAAPLVHPGSSS